MSEASPRQHWMASVSLLVLVLTWPSPVAGVKNVLFLMSDDMRPELGVYSGPDSPSRIHPPIHSPNLDALAGRSLLVKRAYVQQAVCSPSRASMLTSRRPDTTHVYDLLTYWREVGGNYTTIPQYFKQHGYTTAGYGKIFHPGQASNHNDPISWTEPYVKGKNYWETNNHTWKAIKEKQWKKHPLIDQQIATGAIKAVKKYGNQYKQTHKPFFLAVGFHRPHLPFVFPDKFSQYYPKSSIHLPDNQYAPANMPVIAWSIYDELRTYQDIAFKYGIGTINTTLPHHLVIALRRAYYSSISYVDDLVGQVLTALKEEGLENSTVVSFVGDHGWQLGEHSEWCKHTNFELSTHAPMMVHVPGLTDKGVVTRALTEFVDLFPTLAEAAELPPVPLCSEVNATNVVTCTEGISMLPLVSKPDREWKTAAFSQYPRMASDGNVIMGYTMRTDKYRYTEWLPFHPWPKFAPDWKVFHKFSIELYDHGTDPDENVNNAFNASYSKIRNQLHNQLKAGWRGALPKRVDSFRDVREQLSNEIPLRL